MTVTVSFDTSQVDTFAAELKGVGSRLPTVVGPVMKRAAQNIKNDLQADFRGSSNPGFRAIGSRISYDDITGSPSSWQTRIGIDKGGAGNLGNIAVFGTYKGGGTHKHPSFYAEKEMSAFTVELLKAVEGLI